MSSLNFDQLGLPLDKTQVLVDTLSAFFKIKENQDPNLAQIFTGYPPPRILTTAYKILKREVDLASDEEYRTQCQSFFNILIDALNEYDRIPILLEEITSGRRKLPRKTVLAPPATSQLQGMGAGFADEEGAFSEHRSDFTPDGIPRIPSGEFDGFIPQQGTTPQIVMEDGTGFVMEGFGAELPESELEDIEDIEEE
jgi:hypothetical protein